jgi:hypothetical protein
MKGGPFEYQRHGSPREISPEDGERLYLDEGLVSAIFGMKMRRSVVVKNTPPQQNLWGDSGSGNRPKL